MINDYFQKNWSKILDFNLGIQDEEEDLKKLTVNVRIPTTPIEIDASLLYKLFTNIYPELVNDKENVIDIVISNDEKTIKAIYLHITRFNGNHLQVIDINKKIYAFQTKDLDDIEDMFEKIQIILREKERINVSGMRIFKENAVNLLRDLTSNLENNDLITNLNNIFSTYYDIIFNDLFFIFPEPPLVIFLKKIVKFTSFVESNNIINKINGLMSSFNISATFGNKSLLFSILIKKENMFNADKDEWLSELSIKIINNEEPDYNFDNFNPKSFLNQFKKKYKTGHSYFFYFDKTLNLFSDVIESDFPFEQERESLLLQKLLLIYKNYDIDWFSYPSPISYNFFVKFFSRIIGFNINLRKLSYWAIPELIANVSSSLMGLKNRLVVIVTDVKSSQRENESIQDLLNASYSSGYLIETLNGKLSSAQKLDKSDVLLDGINTLGDVRNRLSSKYGFIAYVIKIDKMLIGAVINNFILNLTRFNPFAKLFTLRKLRNKRYLNYYPKLSIYQKVKLRKTLPLLIDKHEF